MGIPCRKNLVFSYQGMISTFYLRLLCVDPTTESPSFLIQSYLLKILQYLVGGSSLSTDPLCNVQFICLLSSGSVLTTYSLPSSLIFSSSCLFMPFSVSACDECGNSQGDFWEAHNWGTEILTRSVDSSLCLSGLLLHKLSRFLLSQQVS